MTPATAIRTEFMKTVIGAAEISSTRATTAFVVFDSGANNLVGDDTNGKGEVAISAGTPGADGGIILMLVSLGVFIIAFTMGGLNYVTTVLQARCKGMTLMRMPLSIWGLLIAALLQLFALPVLTAAGFMQLFDRIFEYLDMDPEITDAPDAVALDAIGYDELGNDYTDDSKAIAHVIKFCEGSIDIDKKVDADGDGVYNDRETVELGTGTGGGTAHDRDHRATHGVDRAAHRSHRTPDRDHGTPDGDDGSARRRRGHRRATDG